MLVGAEQAPSAFRLIRVSFAFLVFVVFIPFAVVAAYWVGQASARGVLVAAAFIILFCHRFSPPYPKYIIIFPSRNLLYAAAERMAGTPAFGWGALTGYAIM
ncbi:hypothetical protein ABXS71_18965 [Bacillus infantis]|uniref:hypothetical protein n=1 Tax=Bacillus infantis TaxID=324767 RepID=UPI00344D8B48